MPARGGTHPEGNRAMKITGAKVIVTCPGGSGLALSVMAVPGQEVELDPRPKN